MFDSLHGNLIVAKIRRTGRILIHNKCSVISFTFDGAIPVNKTFQYPLGISTVASSGNVAICRSKKGAGHYVHYRYISLFGKFAHPVFQCSPCSLIQGGFLRRNIR
ncbi:Uncharacterised protein [Salmonella enterica subsp. enterica serovar Typhimurium]|nr:Uncharacterised protein [Salmonella enterica subsp. enterica serovar Typhimurium]